MGKKVLTSGEAFEERPPRYCGLWTCGEWQIKTYGIAYRRPTVRPGLLDIAKDVSATTLPQPAVTDCRYGVGFLGVHDGRGGIYIFCNWWENDNELHHHLWGGPDVDGIEYLSPTGLFACVFEMRVIMAERRHWIDTMLRSPADADVDAYLARTQT